MNNQGIKGSKPQATEAQQSPTQQKSGIAGGQQQVSSQQGQFSQAPGRTGQELNRPSSKERTSRTSEEQDTDF